MSEWQPIETASMDGSLLLVGWWREWPYREWEQEVKAAGDFTRQQGENWKHGYATHWMPLPDPPMEAPSPPETS